MQMWRVWLVSLVAMTALAPAASFAADGLSLRHRIDAVTPSGSGCVVELYLELTNAGPEGLGETRLVARDPYFPPVEESNILTIPTLAVAETLPLYWSIPTVSCQQLQVGMEMPLYVDVETAAGDGVLKYQISSEGGL